MTLFKPDKKKIGILSPEVKFLADLASGSPVTDIPASNSGSDIIRLARYQKLSYFIIQLSRQQPQLFTAAQNERLERMSAGNSARALLQLNELLNISNLLSGAGISYVVIKGPQLARMLYGKQSLKESVDLDIILAEKNDLENVRELLSRAGYLQAGLKSDPKRLYGKLFTEAKREVVFVNSDKNTAVDLHLKPSPNSYLTSNKLKDFTADPQYFDIEGNKVPILPPEKYLVFLCHHAALHQFSRLGWINDIRNFIKIVRPDIKKTHQIARRTGTERSLLTAIFLINKIFGDEMPEMHCEFGEIRTSGKLAMASIALLKRTPGFLMTFRGRLFRLRYLLMLNRGFYGKIDVFTGIFLRTLLKITG